MKVLVIGLIAVAVLAVLLFLVLHQARDSGDLEARLDKVVRDIIERKMTRGLAVAVYQRGQIFTKGYGDFADLNADEVNSAVFEIASITKVFTGALLQAVVDEGALSFDAELGDLYGNVTEISPSLGTITLRELATHTSGLPNLPKAFFEKSEDSKNPYANLSISDLHTYLNAPDGLGTRGKSVYSNLGVGLLGHVIQSFMGEDLEALMRRHILTPLKMDRTGFELTAEVQRHFVQGHNASGEVTHLGIFRF